MVTKNWIVFDISCPEETIDELAAEIVEEFGVAVEIIPEGIRLYLEGGASFQKWESELKRLLDSFTKRFQPSSSLTYTYFSLEDDSWADRWKEYFKPLRVGRSFVICPTWEPFQPESQDRVIQIDPGRAFGTGHHETTRLCLEWLEDRAVEQGGLNGCTLLDVGTGSGILAMGAALLGCPSVTAIDNDSEAVEVAKENVELNKLTSQIQLSTGTASNITSRFDIVLANIEAMPLIEMASDLLQCLSPKGTLVLSGILLEQKDNVKWTYKKKGITFSSIRELGEWCLLIFDK